MKKFFDKIFWLNTRARSGDNDRGGNMRKRLAGYDAERFEAIFGSSEIAWKCFKADGLFIPPTPRRKLNNGEIGCFISHREIWKEAKSRGHNRILVLEDDAEFKQGAVETFERDIDKLPEWDLLYLGQRNYDNMRNSRTSDGDNAALIEHISGNLYKADGCWLTHAYAVNMKCVDYLLENTKCIDYPIDGVLAGLQKNLNTYAFYPNIIGQDRTKSSLR